MHLRSYKCLLNQLKPCEMVILFCFNSSWHDFAEKLQKAVFLQWKDKMMWFKNAMWLLSSSTFMACMFFFLDYDEQTWMQLEKLQLKWLLLALL